MAHITQLNTKLDFSVTHFNKYYKLFYSSLIFVCNKFILFFNILSDVFSMILFTIFFCAFLVALAQVLLISAFCLKNCFKKCWNYLKKSSQKLKCMFIKSTNRNSSFEKIGWHCLSLIQQINSLWLHLVGLLFCFMAYQLFSGHLTPI